jgi:hypothetical protein
MVNKPLKQISPKKQWQSIWDVLLPNSGGLGSQSLLMDKLK